MRYMVLVMAGLMGLGVIDNIGAQSSPDGPRRDTLGVVGVSHLDTQWRWTIQETINKYIPATYRDNTRLMDLYPHYVFSFEGAFRYMLLREYYPADYENLKKYIAAGRWRVAGSWVDAVDVNIPAFESLVRHALYGNGFFKQEFGKTSRDILLPDCFGFGYALPSIAAHCGLRSFSTQKLTWGSAYGVPFDIGTWEGVDGSTIIAALRPGDYVSKIKDDLSRDTLWTRRIDSLGDLTGFYTGYRYFGTGDIGGAPESASVAWLEQSVTGDGPLAVKSIGSDDIVDMVAGQKNIKLPHYKGELLMTRHGVGCYSSQAAMKRWNRKNELLANAAERASVIAWVLAGKEYPRDAFRENWIRFLWHQFHDDITGTSIPEAYAFSWSDEILCLNRFAGILEDAVAATAPMLDTRAQGVPLLVFNPLSISRQDIVEATVVYPKGALKAVQVYDPDGNEVPSQMTAAFADSITILFSARVPSVGYAVYDVRPATSLCTLATGLHAEKTLLENQRYTVRLNDAGDVVSIWDKTAQRELLARPLALQLLPDNPDRWPAWEIDYDDISAPPKPFGEGPADIRVVENGPARVALEITRRMGTSIARTMLRLAAGEAGNIVEFANDIEWYEKASLLKVALPVTTPNDSVTYDIGLGAISRGLNRAELYEVPGQQWADITSVNGDYGVALLNDCRYGWDHPAPETLRLTLLHTPGVSESWSWVKDQSSQDLGRHSLTFAVMGHRGDWRDGGVPWQAARLNEPLLAFQTASHPCSTGKLFSLVSLESGGGETATPPLMVTAVKLAENNDDIVIRLRELTGRQIENARIRLNAASRTAKEINGVEEAQADVRLENGSILVSANAYQPKSYAIAVAKSGQPMSRSDFTPLTIPYNTDGISLDGARRDGNFDGDGNTLAGELLADTLLYQGIPFVVGPKSNGSMNMADCHGQTLTIPSGDFNRLYLLVSSVGGPAVGTIGVGDRRIDLKVPDYAEPLGQWCSRLTGEKPAEEASDIMPAYINRMPVAWAGSHRHTAEGKNEAYRFTYLFCLPVDITPSLSRITLPDNPRIKLLAATAARSDAGNTCSASPLYDVANSAVVTVMPGKHHFIDSVEITLSCPLPGADIYYTLDGSEPTSKSPLYKSPFTIAETSTVKARGMAEGADSRYVNTAVFTKLTARQPVEISSVSKGLRCRYYEGVWEKLPKFDSLIVQREIVMDAIAIPSSARKEGYGLVFTGYIQIPRRGMYEFSLASDDGSSLYIGDTLLINNDGIHGETEISGEVALETGYHRITIYMFQGKGGQALSASISGPDLPRQTIPPGMLFH